MKNAHAYIIQPKRKRQIVSTAKGHHLLGSSALSTRKLSLLTAVGVFAAGFSTPFDAFAVADPSTITNVSGSTTSVINNPGHLETTQNTGHAIIAAPNVDVLDSESWRIYQPSSSSSLLVRVTGGSPTKILGELSANGQLMLVNGSGVFFGKNSQVNVAGLIASTADISNENFNANILKFDRPGRPDAAILNHGTITAKEGGLVALLAPSVLNDGVITADLGTVAIGAGEAFTLDFYGDNLFSFSVDKAAEGKGKDEDGKDLDDAITNAGTVKGGRIFMTARSAKEVVDHAINTTGIVEANSARMEGGDIVLDGGEGSVLVAGNVKASGKKGGHITITGKDNITLADNTRIDASGDTQGGIIRIGGNKKGKGTLAHAQTVDIGKGTVLSASGISGNAGDVVVWSDKATVFKGFIDISSKDGSGGNAEVSSKDQLTYAGFTNAKGQNFGTLLLDPGNWTISNAATSANNYNNVDLGNQLDAANVALSTYTQPAQPGELGDINVLNNVTWSGAGTLLLEAEHDINVNALITSNYAGPVTNFDKGSLIMGALNDINITKTITTNAGGILGVSSNSNYHLVGNAQLNSKTGQISASGNKAFISDSKNSINTGGDVQVGVGTMGVIQNAVDALGTIGGNTVLSLSNTTYNENVIIDTSNVTMIDSSAGSGAIVQGVAGKGQSGTIAVANGAKNVHIGRTLANGTISQGFRVFGVDNGNAGVINAAINFLGNNGGSSVTAMDITTTGKTHGIYIANNNTPGLAGTITIGGTVDGEGNIIKGTGIDGLRIMSSSNILVGRNTISGTTGAGVLAVNSSDLLIDSNKISNVGTKTSAAIATQGGANIEISSNNISNTARNGIQISEATGKNSIHNNIIDGAPVFGILVNKVPGNQQGAGVAVYDNVIGKAAGSNSGSGIANIGSTFARFTNNTISNYHGGINVNTGALNNVISGNTINLRAGGTGVIVDTGSDNTQLSGNTVNGDSTGNNGTTVGYAIARSTGVSSTNDQSFNNLVGMRIDNAQNTTVTGGTFSGNSVGMFVLNGSGNTLVSNTRFMNGTLGVLLQGAGSTFGFGDNLSRFDNLDGYFVLNNNAMFGQTIDASQQTFEGVRAQNFSDAEFAAARLKTVDSETVPTVGFVFYRAAPVTPPQPPTPTTPVAGGFSQELLDQLLQRDLNPLRDVFSYAGKTVDSTYVLSPYNFSVQTLNLSLLSPNSGGPVAPVTPGAITPGTNLANLAPAAGGNADSPTGTALASLSPSAGGSAAETCVNSFLSDGLSGGNCTLQQ